MSGIAYNYKCDICGKDQVKSPFAPQVLHHYANAENQAPQACYMCARAIAPKQEVQTVDNKEDRIRIAAERLALLRNRQAGKQPVREEELTYADEGPPVYDEDEEAYEPYDQEAEEEALYRRLESRFSRNEVRQASKRQTSPLLLAMQQLEIAEKNLEAAQYAYERTKELLNKAEDDIEEAESKLRELWQQRDARRGRRPGKPVYSRRR